MANLPSFPDVSRIGADNACVHPVFSLQFHCKKHRQNARRDKCELRTVYGGATKAADNPFDAHWSPYLLAAFTAS
jgi:hypothetical protein